MAIATVLIVDDSMIDRLILENLLCTMECRVISAVCGEDAIEQVYRHTPDLILMDIQMPGIGGISAIKKIRRILQQKWVPIVLVSGLAEDFDLMAGLSAGADDFLQKPVRPRFLRKKLASMLRKLYACSSPQDLAYYSPGTEAAVEIDTVIRELTHGAPEELHVLYEPVVSLRDGKILALEAEVHWYHATLGHIPPSSFVPIAEQLGRIDNITQYVFDTVIAFQRLLSTHAIDMTINVNLSPVELLTGKFKTDKIRSMFASADIPVNSVTLEITENALLNNMSQFRLRCTELRNAGFKIGLDDVSLEHGSLADLQLFDYLKFDSSLIKSSGLAAVSLRARYDPIISYAKELKTLLIGEGIDSEYILGAVDDLGFDAGQGSLYWHPMRGEEVFKLLKAGSIGYKNSHTRTYLPNATRRHD